ncbi:transmembrane protein, putative (macronuclear) [Tetrahymena thermophila SB210]|uniref:Transmembrane protein, putative n=1 Tax=Tetrahymena thermophila (strain SB210) TaxID=312017 RepID=Q23H72_TETTS|nr:transmembrane protein, putative [Tetrahymena thermophila SB210]EAR95936.1 transmembrane protein, putative [Tetrahymena thermophila SB210]|eukprot:XP_001016181.1 transmembrane protein, putative [Tetrahymena thermophila SB210]
MCCNLSPKSLRCSNGFLTVLAIIVSVVVLVLSVVSGVNYKQGFIFVEYAVNWNNEVIIDVAYVDAQTGQCTQTNLPALAYQFGGLSSGCDCTSSGGSVSTSSCSSSQAATCSKVKAIPQTTMQNWIDASGNPLRLCFTRLPGYKFSEKFLINSQCRDPANEKMCGGSNPLIAFCVPNNQKCPVQSISTSQVNPTDEQIGTTGLWLQRGNANQLGLSELYLSEQQGMCIDSLEAYWDGVQTPYKLLKDYYYGKCKIDTVYWNKVQDTSKANFFKANGMDPTNFPGLVTGSNVSLQQRKYLPWNQQCRTGSQMSDLINVTLNYVSDYNNHKYLYKVCIGNVVFLGIYCLFLFMGCFTSQIKRKCCACRGCCKTSLCCCPCLREGCTLTICTLRSPECIRKCWTKKDLEDSCFDYCRLVDPIHILLVIVKFGFDLAMLGLSAMNFVNVKSYKNSLSNIAKLNCSTDDFNSSIQSTSDSLNNIVHPLDAVVLAILVVYVCLSVLGIITYICNQVSKRRAMLKQKCQLKQVKVIDECDQTIPTILSQITVVGETPIQNGQNVSMQLQQNLYPQQQAYPYPQQQVNPYQPAQPPLMQQQNQQMNMQPMQIAQPVYYQQPQNYPQQQY